MSKDKPSGADALGEIGRRLADLFDHLADPGNGDSPRSGRREKNGMVVEYSFGKRSLHEGGRPQAEPASESATASAKEAPRRRAPKPDPLSILEPVTDVFDEPDELVVLYELPGASRNDIQCVLNGDILLLDAKAGDRTYHKEILVAAKLAAGGPVLRLKNGILEVRLAKQA
jgi:HSP20 family protein